MGTRPVSNATVTLSPLSRVLGTVDFLFRMWTENPLTKSGQPVSGGGGALFSPSLFKVAEIVRHYFAEPAAGTVVRRPPGLEGGTKKEDTTRIFRQLEFSAAEFGWVSKRK